MDIWIKTESNTDHGGVMMRNYRARGITKDGQPIFSEDHEQQLVAEYLRLKRIDFIHVPNGGSRNVIEARKLKRMGVTPGVSDFIIFTPPKDLGFIHGAIELKALDGRPPTREQLDFLERRAKQYWLVNWCKGSAAAIEWIKIHWR